jgi:hypothetical protein
MENIPTNQKVRKEKDLKGSFNNCIGIITNPTDTIAKLKEKPRMLLVLFLIIIIITILFYIKMPLIEEFNREMVLKSIEAMENRMPGNEIPDNMLDLQIKIATYASVGGISVSIAIAWLIAAVISFITLKIVKGKGSFKQLLSFHAYALIISMLLSTIVQFFISYRTGVFPELVPSTSIVSILDTSDTGAFMTGILKSIDIFNIWFYSLLYIAFKVIGELNERKAFNTIVVLFLLSAVYLGINEVISSFALNGMGG